ncbi:uncharacterized protein LOC126661740 [Mercurialis annua]|uniref:uncharacterized protein LOC126661740 n=1 Tax=Mercurialis annua TaxID=3986 RepID=UPI002160F135|nr:uncharacterized protein LOC126661740 [Mercurialis annua]
METDRSWMYRSHTNGLLTTGYKEHVKEFVRFALRHPTCMTGVQIKCPCPKRGCRNTSYRDVDVVEFHLLKNGFVKGYQLPEQDVEFNYENEGPSKFSCAQRMILDAAGPEITFPEDELPNAEAQKFYDMMRAAEEDIWPGNSRHSPFSASAKVMEIKCRHKGLVALVDDVCGLIQELLPEDNKMPTNFAKIKKLVKGLGLPVEVIDCCFYNCMIYLGEDADLTHCKVCNYARWKPMTHGKSTKRKANVPYSKMFYFPITLRLQRLYASKATARHMTWHADHEMDGDKMCHPSDSPAWKRFSELHSEFADEGRNIRLGHNQKLKMSISRPKSSRTKDSIRAPSYIRLRPGSSSGFMDPKGQIIRPELRDVLKYQNHDNLVPKLSGLQGPTELRGPAQEHTLVLIEARIPVSDLSLGAVCGKRVISPVLLLFF